MEKEELMKEVLRLRKALQVYQEHNNIRNDLDAYLYELGEWAFGKSKNCPKSEDYGLKY